MSRETIYEIACEMLQTTNNYRKDVAEIKYINKDGQEQSLLDVVKANRSIHSYKYRGKSVQNIERAFDAIVSGMLDFLESYPAPFSFKQKTRSNFYAWLKRIQEAYDICETALPKAMEPSKSDRHIGVAILKHLHPRKGATVKKMAENLKVSTRAIQKDLIKLSASPNDDSNQDERLRLGGQPLQAIIETVKDPHTGKEVNPKAYFTRNTVSPLVLQENIMQLATLLKALCRQFWNYNDDSARIIAVDIWNQMTEYAQEKIKRHYTYDNKDLKYFIEMLDDDFPDDQKCPYYTEQQMLDKLETPLPVDQAIPALMKVENRAGLISLTDGRTILAKRLSYASTDDEIATYEAIDPHGNHVIFTTAQVEEVEII